MKRGTKSCDKFAAGGGTYSLLLSMWESQRLQIGKLGKFDFPRGWYVYTGSALGGLSARLKRHLRPEKRLHWHIDYLLQAADIEEVWYTQGTERLECTWNGMIAALPGARPYIRGFGSSDCRCHSHLTFFISRPSFDMFRKRCNDIKIPPPVQTRTMHH